jgi:hypothetical protein
MGEKRVEHHNSEELQSCRSWRIVDVLENTMAVISRRRFNAAAGE